MDNKDILVIPEPIAPIIAPPPIIETFSISISPDKKEEGEDGE